MLVLAQSSPAPTQQPIALVLSRGEDDVLFAQLADLGIEARLATPAERGIVVLCSPDRSADARALELHLLRELPGLLAPKLLIIAEPPPLPIQLARPVPVTVRPPRYQPGPRQERVPCPTCHAAVAHPCRPATLGRHSYHLTRERLTR